MEVYASNLIQSMQVLFSAAGVVIGGGIGLLLYNKGKFPTKNGIPVTEIWVYLQKDLKSLKRNTIKAYRDKRN